MTAIKCPSVLICRDGVLTHEGFRGHASRPPDHIQPAPCTTLPRNRHIDLKGQKILVYSVHCFRGYYCGNYLEPVVQWTMQNVAFKHRVKRGWARLVHGWVIIRTDPFISILDFSFTSLTELFELSLRVTYCVSPTVHDTNASRQSIAELQAKEITVLNFTPGWFVQGFLEKRPTWEGLAKSAKP